ncbi:MAG: glycosyltransferase family 4 protein [Planctomycetaceae bacterium]|nr:glycosyltransferase family 4 protein [Planctomycetaceae bacterium]
MKIGIVIEELDPARGGAQQWTWQFVRWLAAAGHETHIVARRFADCVKDAGFTLHPTVPTRTQLEFGAAAENVVRQLELDVVHDMGDGWCCDVLQPHNGARGAAFQQNLRLIPAWLRPWKRALAALLPRYRNFAELSRRQYAADGRVLIALSKMVAADLQQHHGVPPGQLRLIYNGVNFERFSPDQRSAHRAALRDQLRVAADETLFLIVAHNFALKGVPELIRAVAELAWEGRPVRLAIAGGKRTGSAARLARRVGIAERVTLLGSVPDAAPYYAACDVYVQPTFYDPCSLVVLEALAAGVPVITSRYNGAGELITPGVEGSIVQDPADVGELADALRWWCDPGRRERGGRAARKLALEHGWERNCREIVALYEEIAARRATRARRAA